jgi:hypothetical protein
MIRPLTNEEELQNLDCRPLEELRGEFVEQVQLLRKRVLFNVKPKAVNGHLVSGAEWIALVELYVNAINNGVVPSIQSAWTSICRQAANQALEQAKATFEQELASFVVHLPMNQEDLEAFLREQLQALSDEVLVAKGDAEILKESQASFAQYVAARSTDVL